VRHPHQVRPEEKQEQRMGWVGSPNSLLVFLLLLLQGSVRCHLLQSEGPFECPGDGLFADPDNCQMFYDCANGRPFHEACPSGTLFDDRLLICNFEDQVNCGDRPMPGSTRPPSTSSTSAPVTDTTMHTTTIKEETTVATTEAGSTMTATATEPVTTTSQVVTTSSESSTTHGPGPDGLPKYVVGMYILLADDTEDGFHTDSDWNPLLHEYQQTGANVLFFTFINPASMEVPVSFQKLAASRGTGAEGSVPADTRIIFAVGGYAYSLNPNPWEWLTSREAAESMAEKVAAWRDLYGIDGVDLDIEEGAGSRGEAGPNLVHFIRKLKSLLPGFLVTQPTYGYPQVQAEIDVINASWNVGGTSNGLADSVGLMVYEGTQALQYVKNYAEGSSQWEGFPIKVDVPKNQILLGSKGSSGSGTISTLAQETVSQGLLGIMVWFCSVRDGLVYGSGWDCSDSTDSQDGYVQALTYFNQHM